MKTMHESLVVPRLFSMNFSVNSFKKYKKYSSICIESTIMDWKFVTFITCKDKPTQGC